MKAFYTYGVMVLAMFLCVSLTSISAEAQSKKKKYTNQGNVEYNATPNSPTLPLVQYPPPQNYPTSVQIGTPNYYYYYPPVYGAGYTSGAYNPYGNPYGAGASFYNSGGTTQRTFYYNTPIPGQIPLGGGGWGGGGFGGYGGYNGGLFIP